MTPPNSRAEALARSERLDRDGYGSRDEILAHSVSVPRHVVQFYESHAFLVERVAEYLAAGLGAGDPAVAVTTPETRAAVQTRLTHLGVDPAEAIARGALVFLDAADTLSRILIGDVPNREAFERVVGRLVRERASFAHGTLRVYGEMVDVLFRSHNVAGALELEVLWNDLQHGQAFSLFCAYAMNDSASEPTIRSICAAHGQVLEPDHREVADDGTPGVGKGLRRHVRSLVNEIARRRDSERALRESIHELRKAEEGLRQSQLETERLTRITSAIADAVLPEQVYEAIVDQVARGASASSAALWLLDEAAGTMTLVRSLGYSEESRNRFGRVALHSPARFPALDALSDGRPLWLDSPEHLVARYPHLVDDIRRGGEYRVACLPLIVQGRPFAVLGFTSDGPGPLGEADRAFLLLAARSAGHALERLQLLESEQASRARAEANAMRMAALTERAELLYRLAGDCIEATAVDDVYEAALNAIQGGLHTNRAAILVFDTGDVMRFKAARGLSPEYRQAVEGHSPWSRDVRSPEPIFVPDSQADPSLASYASLFRAESIGALGFFPLVASGKLIGKFMVYYDQPRDLSPQERDLARAIANHVATAIDRFEALHELQRTVRFNEMFTAILGHDLRNPLASILTAAQLLVTRAKDEEHLRPLRRVIKSGARMSRMIDQLLDFTRLRVGGGIPLVPRTMDLHVLVQQVVDELDDAHPECVLRVVQDGDCTGCWDSDRLSQVFSNLVGNAVQHGARESGVLVAVNGSSPESVEVSVHNMGAIPAEVVPRLFEPMTGAAERRDGSHGLGLGLFISQQIVRAHGGSIELRSDPAHGTTFTISLPRRGNRSEVGR